MSDWKNEAKIWAENTAYWRDERALPAEARAREARLAIAAMWLLLTDEAKWALSTIELDGGREVLTVIDEALDNTTGRPADG